MCIWTNNVNVGWQRRWGQVGGKHGCITRSAGGQSYPRRVSGDSPKILPGIQHRFGSWNSCSQGGKSVWPSWPSPALASGTRQKGMVQSLQRELTAWSNGCLGACSPSLKVSCRQLTGIPLKQVRTFISVLTAAVAGYIAPPGRSRLLGKQSAGSVPVLGGT